MKLKTNPDFSTLVCQSKLNSSRTDYAMPGFADNYRAIFGITKPRLAT